MSQDRDDGTYLIFADKGDDFDPILPYIARLTKMHNMHPALVRVMEPQDFTHWGKIASRMRNDLRKESEDMVWRMGRDIYEITGLLSSFYVEEGNRYNVITRIIQDNQNIKMLILVASTRHGASPGALISHFTGKDLSNLRVPVLVIPSHLTPDEIEKLL